MITEQQMITALLNAPAKPEVEQAIVDGFAEGLVGEYRKMGLTEDLMYRIFEKAIAEITAGKTAS